MNLSLIINYINIYLLFLYIINYDYFYSNAFYLVLFYFNVSYIFDTVK